jgi:hypothetical protein
MLVRLTLAAATASLLPAAATAAPALEPLRPCYDAVSRDDGGTEAVRLAGSGFTPGSLVDILVDGELRYPRVQVDAAGALPAGLLPAPFVAKGRRPFTVTVTEQGNAAQTAAVSSLVTALDVEVRPRAATPATRVRFKGSGFTARRPVHLHYVRGGRARETVRLVRRPQGPCGDFDVRRRQFPFLPSVGRWQLQFDQQRRFERAPDGAFLRLRIDVRRR